MKKIIPLITLIVILLNIISCSKDNTTDPTNTTPPTGQWRIHYYWDDKDETTDFSGYNFSFKDNGVLTATKAASVINGSWNISQSSDDDSSNDLDMNIVFTSPDDFEDLTEDWDFISETSSKMELIHISGGNGGTDYLTFEKN